MRSLAIAALLAPVLGPSPQDPISAPPVDDEARPAEAVTQTPPRGWQGFSPIQPHPDWADVSYAPDGEGNAYQRLYFFPPEGEPPEGGWPVLVQLLLAGFEAVQPVPQLQKRHVLSYQAHRHGIAVVTARLTPTDDALPGRGTFTPDGAHATAETDVVHIVQFLRERAAQGELPIDPRRIALAGVSAAAISAQWCALGPRRAPRGVEGQTGRGTRIAAVLIDQAVTWWPALHERAPGKHFACIDDPELPAGSLGSADPEHLLAASSLEYGFATRELRKMNGRLPVYLSYVDDPSYRSFDPPYAPEVLRPGRIHDAWFGLALWSALVAADPAQLDRSRMVLSGAEGSKNLRVPGVEHLPRPLVGPDQVRWLLSTFGLDGAEGGWSYYLHEHVQEADADGAQANPTELWVEGELAAGGYFELCARVGRGTQALVRISEHFADELVEEGPGGARLIDFERLAVPALAIRGRNDAVARAGFRVPADGSWSGRRLFAQAALVAEDGERLSNGIELRFP